MATLHQVILRRTGVYILPGEPANRWIIETPTITEGLRHRVRRILGPRIEELTEGWPLPKIPVPYWPP